MLFVGKNTFGSRTLFLKSAHRLMAKNIEILSRQNVLSFIAKMGAVNLDIVPSKDKESGQLRKYSDGTQKYFFALDNAEGTRGAVSHSLAKELESGKKLNVADLVMADTIEEGSTEHIALLMKRGEGNSIQTISVR